MCVSEWVRSFLTAHQHKKALSCHSRIILLIIALTLSLLDVLYQVRFGGCRFLCAGKYFALLIEHEWSGPQHPAQGGVTFPGILFMTWRAQGVMNGWLLVFLYRMCCRKASCAVVWLVEFQGVRRKPCMLPPFGHNFWPCLSRVNFSDFFTLRLCRQDDSRIWRPELRRRTEDSETQYLRRKT